MSEKAEIAVVLDDDDGLHRSGKSWDQENHRT